MMVSLPTSVRIWLATHATDLLKSFDSLAELVRPEDTFILVDQETFRSKISAGRRAIPFLERQGQYWGLPPDDATAIHELERLRGTGVAAIIFAWPTFWWFDYYKAFHKHLNARYRRVRDTDEYVIFSLTKVE